MRRVGGGPGPGRAGLPGALTSVPAAPAAPAAALHAEPYIMFSTDKKSLLCIRCFRDMQGWVGGEREARGCRRAAGSGADARGPRRESRAHCVDLESAYVQGCERLEQAVLVSAGCPARRGRGGARLPG